MLHVFIPEQDPQAVDDSVDLQPSIQASHAWLSESGCVKLGLLRRLRFYADEHKEDFQGCTVKPKAVRRSRILRKQRSASCIDFHPWTSTIVPISHIKTKSLVAEDDRIHLPLSLQSCRV